jgi:hypothetical protein
VPVAHACNPSYSGGRDQEDGSSKLARQIVQKALLENTKRAGRVAQGEGPEFKSQYRKKKKAAFSFFRVDLVYCWGKNLLCVPPFLPTLPHAPAEGR